MKIWESKVSIPIIMQWKKTINQPGNIHIQLANLMTPISKFEFLNELAKLNIANDFYIELESLNDMISRLNRNDIFCCFDYLDIEEYAFSIPNIAEISTTKILFRPTTSWTGGLRLMSNNSNEFSEPFRKVYHESDEY